jgi:hypothetical protein
MRIGVLLRAGVARDPARRAKPERQSNELCIIGVGKIPSYTRVLNVRGE